MAKEGSFYEAEFETDRCLLQNQARPIEDKSAEKIGGHLIQIDQESDLVHHFSRGSQRLQGTEEKSVISLLPQDFDLSNTVQTRNSLMEDPLSDELINLIN